MKKRVLSLITTLCLLFALLPTTAFAEEVNSVDKITPYIESVAANPITYGQTLADSSVQGSVYSDSTKQTAVEGSFIWENETIKPTAKDDSNTTLYTVIFKPTDTATYNEATAQVTITVNKAQNAPNMPDSAMSVLYSIKVVFMADLPANWRWQDSDRREALEVEVAKKATAMYNGADKGNYINESIEITITRTDCPEHVAGEIRYDGPFDYIPDCWGMDGNGHRECTKCGEILEQVRVPFGHTDANKDHSCDRCLVWVGTCEDADKDHKCDYGCGKDFGTHVDADLNHICDYGCDEAIGICADADYDHKCDYGCGKNFGTHVDADLNHICDYGCKEAIGICADADKDHKCDYGCGKTFGVCSGGTATCKDNAVCDYCGKPYGELNSSNHAGGTEVRNVKDVTCTEDGYTGDTYCKGCETKLSSGKSVDKTGHDYESKVTKEATTTSTGTKTYTCKNCGHSYEEEIAKLPSQSTSPKTGDETPLGMTIAVTTLSAVALAVLLFLNKKRKVN